MSEVLPTGSVTAAPVTAPVSNAPACDGDTLEAGALEYLQGMIGLRRGESILILYDNEKRDIAEAFEKAAKKLGAPVTFFNIDEHGRFSPEGVAAILRTVTPQADSFINDGSFGALAEVIKNKQPVNVVSNYDVFLNLVSTREGEMPGRVRMVRSQMMLANAAALNAQGGFAARPVRIAHGPGTTPEMICARPDFIRMNTQAERLKLLFAHAQRIRITTPEGTDLWLDVTDRQPDIDVLLNPNGICNIPSGEFFIPAVENQGNGTIIVTGSIGIGGDEMPPSPVRIAVENGQVMSVGWQQAGFSDDAYLKRINDVLAIDPMARQIGEFGIGLAPFPVIGNLLQDEKSAGTVHVAFGTNVDIGGQNTSGSHVDCILKKPTVYIYYSPESGLAPRTIMWDGRLYLD